MTHFINFVQSAIVGGWLDHLSKQDQAVVKALPFIGIGVVLSGLAILAIILSQLYRFGGGSGSTPSPKSATPPSKPAEPQAKAKIPETEDSELEKVAVATALSIYMNETSEAVYLTETKQYYNNNPWTNESLAKQSRRFKRWQAIKK